MSIEYFGLSLQHDLKSKMKRSGAKSVGWVPNTARLNGRLKWWYRLRLSSKSPKELDNIHKTSWRRILSGEQPNINVHTLMNKIAPALGIDPIEMSAEIAIALKENPRAQQPYGDLLKRGTPPQDKPSSAPEVAPIGLTWEMLPELEKAPELCAQLSEGDKLLLLGVSLQNFLLPAWGAKRCFRDLYGRDIPSFISYSDHDVMPKDYYDHEKRIHRLFAEGMLTQDPLLLGVKELRTHPYVAPDPEHQFVIKLQEVRSRSGRDPDFREAVSGLSFLLKRAKTFTWQRPRAKRDLYVEDVVEAASRVRSELADCILRGSKPPFSKQFLRKVCHLGKA